jgi:hypothetical protein
MRPSPATAIALLALFVALGGGAYAASRVGTSEIAAQAVTTKKLARDAVTGRKADEATFGPVPAAESLTDRSEFFFQLAPGQEEIVAQNGPLTLRAQCIDDPAANDLVRIVAETTAPGSALEGNDNLNNTTTGFLEPGTPVDQRQLLRHQAPTTVPSVDNDINEGFVTAPGGETLVIDGDATVLALNYGGAECRLVGAVDAFGP